MESEQISEDELAEEILRYFVEHPKAADSLEGIAKWRLGHASSGNLACTAGALKRLVEFSFIEEIPILGSGPVFRLQEMNLAGAKEFLASRKRPG